MGNLHRQLFWLIIFRLVVFTTLLGSIILVQALGTEVGWSFGPFFLLLLGVFGFSGLYLALYKLGLDDRANAYFQFLGDVLVVGGLLYFTGGLFSPFAILYFVIVIVAATLLYRQGALIVASLAFTSWGVIVVMTYRHLVPTPIDPRLERIYETLTVQEAYYWLFLYMFGLYAVAYLASYLSENVRRARFRAEESATRVRELEAFHQSLVESMTIGLLTTDEEGRITFASGSTVALLGRTAEEVEQRHVDEELLGEGGFAGIHAGLLESYQHRMEISRRHPTGETLQLGVTASRLGGPVQGFLLLVEDLTDIKRLEEEIRFKDRMAALGEMAAGLAHEIRNPLASMTGSLEVLDKDLALEGDNARLVGIVRKESKRLDGIIRDFLQYARPRRLEIGTFNLGELARETVDLFRHSVDTVVELDIRMEVDGEVPCYGDQDQVRQIVWNLVRNSVEAMPEGGVLEVKVEPAGEWSRLSVRDTGVGMTAEEQRAAVQPFHSRSRRGAGLGLAIVYRIARDHGGRISIRSRKGEGTEVAVYLPMTPTSVKERDGEPEEAQL